MKNKTYGISKVTWAVSFAYALVFALLCRTNAFSSLDNTVSDMLYQHEQALDGTIYVLGIDQRALEALGPFQTWDRSIVADVIDALNQNTEAMPAAIGIDMMYYGETTNEADSRLCEAAGRYGNVVMGSSVNFKQSLIELPDGNYRLDPYTIESVEEPIPELKAVTKQGHLNTLPDDDGFVRNSIHKIYLDNGNVMNSFAYELYRMYGEKNGLQWEVNPPLHNINQWYIPYSAKPGGFSDDFSVLDVLDGTLPPEMFADSIVLIGPYATGMRDSYPTPIDHGTPMYGVEIHANILQALLNGYFPQAVPPFYQTIFVFVFLLGAFWAFAYFSPRMGALVFVVANVVYFAGIYFLALRGYLFRPIYLPLGMAGLYLGWLVAHYTKELLERHRVTDIFKRYVAPQVVDELMKKNQSELQLGGSKRNIACMFVDIRGFTTMSEALSPEEVVEILNESLGLTSNTIFAHQGTLDKFIGDATMALYNAPLEQEDYIYKAVLTAWDIMKGSIKMEEHMQERFGRSVSFGIGLHCDPAVVGNIGTNIRMDYTAIGDTVNIASRLEASAAPGQVLLSEAVYEAVKDRIDAIPLGSINLKGKTQGVNVYSLRHINEYRHSQTPITDKILEKGK